MRGLTRQHIQVGVTLRLIRDYLSVPAGTLATVQTVTTPVGGGNWHFIVRWKSHRPIADLRRSEQGHRLMPMGSSLTLSEEDLQLFEIATDQDLLSPRPPFEVASPEREHGQDIDQLSIPFDEN